MGDMVWAIFPEDSLDSSVITTVWLGVMVSAFFNLRLGWSLSGLIVPGYMVPLLLQKPLSAAVVFFEAFITYFLAWFFFEKMGRIGKWAPVFGRDRFFALLLFSVLVRLCFDGWILPAFGGYLVQHYGIPLDYRNSLHSFGLIIIVLIANQFWKPGFWGGLIPIVTPVFITYAIVRFVLVEHTNFNISSLAYLYNDIAASMLSAPKAYIILICTAFLASRMNLLYGWEYNGILIPSLLALQCYVPMKIVTSFAEALAICLLAALTLRLPFFHNATIEGARKILLFSTISYVYKYLLALWMLKFAPNENATDYFGFGYLLPTLLAIKMYDREAVAQVLRATLQTSVVAVTGASLIGFALTFLPPPWLPAAGRGATGAALVQTIQEPAVAGLARKVKVELYRTRVTAGILAMEMGEAQAFQAGARALFRYAENHAAPDLDEGVRAMDQAGYTVARTPKNALVLMQRDMAKGWGFYMLNPTPKADLAIEVPAPLDEEGTLEAAAWLFASMEARTLAVAGSLRLANKDGSTDTLANPDTPFEYFHREASRAAVLQVRGHTVEIATAQDRASVSLAAVPLETASALWIQRELPPALDLNLLRSLAGDFSVQWGKRTALNLQRSTARAGFAEFYLDPGSMRQLLFRTVMKSIGPQQEVREERIDGYFQDWALEGKSELAPRGSNLYVKPRLEQLLFFDEQIASPLIRLARTDYGTGGWTAKGLEDLRGAAAMANMLDYRVVRYTHQSTGQEYLIVCEKPLPAPRKYWGTFVLRLGASQPYAIQIPRPMFETNTFEFGVALFERLKANALILAGADPYTNLDGTADLGRPGNKENLVAALTQTVLRESAEDPAILIETRAFGIREDAPLPDADLLMATSTGVVDVAALSPLAYGLRAGLERDGLRVSFADSSPRNAGYEIGNSLPVQYLEETRDREVVRLWLSPFARLQFRQQTENRLEYLRTNAVGIPTEELDLYDRIAGLLAQDGLGERIPDALRAAMDAYVQSQDAVALFAMRQAWPAYRLSRCIDINSKQSFLIFQEESGKLCAVANMSPGRGGTLAVSLTSPPLPPPQAGEKSAGSPPLAGGAGGGKSASLSPGPISRETVAQFIDRRVAWLEPGESS